VIHLSERDDVTERQGTGPTRFDKLFTGIAVERPAWLVPGDITGCEDIGPEDTFDGDHGRLLDRAYEPKSTGVPNASQLEPDRFVDGDSEPGRSEGAWFAATAPPCKQRR
jgi:hypothetical protein